MMVFWQPVPPSVILKAGAGRILNLFPTTGNVFAIFEGSSRPNRLGEGYLRN
jgi:hypothetical protein